MLKNILFKFILVFYRRDFTVVRVFKFLKRSEVRIHYIFNNKRYIFIGDKSEFPPTISRGFTVPIKEVTLDSGKNVTTHVKKCSGPKNDFYGKEPNVPLILGKLRMVPRLHISGRGFGIQIGPVVVESTCKTMNVTNIFNQTLVLGKK